ncbi:hypothetical protein [Flavihumibacter fluvii]|uniref:hypothetical protein n=1 Tax=Flavihumibacter fluvii TaxID=2838157 RepID=UPI001BDEE7FC|nr:hypothetical protein [Flavihumibacter fluvii]ULQ51490.1 hypothetical protein KJS93_15485 [Flavihumibacter fluvii]
MVITEIVDGFADDEPIQNRNKAIEIRKKLILEEREIYLRGIVTSYSWEEVKAMAIDRNLLPQ